MPIIFHNFYDEQIPPYAILSHTWGTEEVTVQDLEKPHSKKALTGQLHRQDQLCRTLQGHQLYVPMLPETLRYATCTWSMW